MSNEFIYQMVGAELILDTGRSLLQKTWLSFFPVELPLRLKRLKCSNGALADISTPLYCNLSKNNSPEEKIPAFSCLRP